MYAFALFGSIDGDVPQIIELFALGAIASRCELRLPVPSMSGHSPRSVANCSVSNIASDFICLKISIFFSFAMSDSKGMRCL